MKWINGLKFVTATLAMITMVALPVAQGAEAKRNNKKTMDQKVKEFMQATQLGDPKRRITVGEFHAKWRKYYPAKNRAKLDHWASLHRDELMPRVDVTKFKDKDGTEKVRLLFTDKNSSFSVVPGKGVIKIGSQTFTKKDGDINGVLKKLIKGDKYFKKHALAKTPFKPKNRALTHAEFNRLTPAQRAQYFLQLRLALDLAQKILTPSKDTKTSMILDPSFEVITRLLRGEEAFAKYVPAVGSRCIVAGYLSAYSENRSCGGEKVGREALEASINSQYTNTFTSAKRCSSGIPCNPLAYGFKDDGSPHCLTGGDVQYATRNCGKLSPLNSKEDKQRIVQSWVKGMGNDTLLRFDETTGKINAEDYKLVEANLNELTKTVDEADQFCQSPEGVKLQDARDEQMSACQEIHVRKILLESFAINPEPVAPDTGAGATQCASVAGSHWDEASKSCLCSDNSAPQNNICPVTGNADGEPTDLLPNDDAETLPNDDSKPVEAAEESSDEEGGWGVWDWLLATGVVAAVVGVLCWTEVISLWGLCDDDDNKSPKYIPPVDPPTTGDPDPPPPDPPAVLPSEGGTGTSETGTGGVR